MTDRWFIQSLSMNIFYGLILRWTREINRVDFWVRLGNLSHFVEGGIDRETQLENQLEMAHKRRLVLRLIRPCSWGRWYMEGCNSSSAEEDTRRSRLGPELRAAKRNLQIRRQRQTQKNNKRRDVLLIPNHMTNKLPVSPINSDQVCISFVPQMGFRIHFQTQQTEPKFPVNKRYYEQQKGLRDIYNFNY